MDMAGRFLTNSDRDEDTPIIRCNAGQEPIHFTGLFVGWDPEYFSKNTFIGKSHPLLSLPSPSLLSPSNTLLAPLFIIITVWTTF